MQQSPVKKRSISLNGHRTSICLEDDFFAALKDIAVSRGQTVTDLINELDAVRSHGNLSSALRLFVLQHYRDLAPV